MISNSLIFLPLMFGQAAAASQGPVLISSKPLAAFGECFIRTQEQTSRPWWFVPSADGGTFSNEAGRQGQTTYVLRLKERGSVLAVELETNAPGVSAEIQLAVRACA